jgi:RNA polymerase sigma-70 factor (ECF subfamily)
MAEAMTELLAEDVRVTMPPHPMWFVGRAQFIDGMKASLDPGSPAYVGEWRCVLTRANRQPAVAHYVCLPGETVFRPQVINVLWIEEETIVEITAFVPSLFPAFGLPPVL